MQSVPRIGRWKVIAKLPIVIAAVAAIAALAAPQQTKPGALVWNFSPSIAIGLYKIAGVEWEKGDYVAAMPTEQLSTVLADARILKPGRLLLKRVAAVEGDTVCRNGPVVSINGGRAAVARITSANGRPLPAWSGCVRLSARQVFLLGDTDGSFDGRYFGCLDAASILGRLSRVLVWNESPRPGVSGDG